jgi:electron transfer flavoprotein beta subunit
VRLFPCLADTICCYACIETSLALGVIELRGIIVCIKPVPDPKYWNRLRFNATTNTLVREGIPSIINTLDKNALEEALRLREKVGGEVIALSLAPRDTIPVLKEALAMGADRAVLLSDKIFAGSDTLATSYLLSSAIKQLGAYDIILCGDQTSDSGTAQVSAQIAEFLGIPNLMHVSAVELTDEVQFMVKAQIEHGYMLVEISPPMVLSVTNQLNEPRYTTLMNILEAEQKSIEVWSSKEMDLAELWVGLDGSPTRMGDFMVPAKRKKAEILQGSPEEQAAELTDRLHRLGFC